MLKIPPNISLKKMVMYFKKHNLIITKTNFKVEIANDYIKENDRLQELLRI